MRTRSETVSFRADDELLKQIDAECAEFKISRGHWVRGVVLAHFHRRESAITQDDLSDLLRRLEHLAGQLDDIRPSVARSLYFVLTRVGNVPADAAKELVRSKFLERGE